MLALLFCLVAGVFIGWTIGANDAANSLGTAVGAGVLTVRQSIILICIFGLAGALLQGHYVIKTIGKGVVPLNDLPKDVALLIAVSASFSAGFWALFATYKKMPISTSHSVVGAVAGAGLAVKAPVHWDKFYSIFLCWVLTPIGSAVLAIILYLLLRYVVIRFIPEKFADKTIHFLLIISGCYVAYSWGANDVANATGVLRGVLDIPSFYLALIGMLAICAGVATWGYRVMETIGSGITHLLPVMAVAAQIASAVNVNIYTLWGIPVSTSHSIVGAVLGVGLIHRASLIRFRVMLEIVFSWVVTPVIAGVIAYIMVTLMNIVS